MHRLAIALVLVLALSPRSMAGTSVPRVLTQAGRLLDANDQPVNGQKHVIFALYNSDNPNTHTPLWSEAQDVNFLNGTYAVVLGDTSQGHTGTAITDDILSQPALWLSVTVDGAELLPRMPVTSAPYALRAGRAAEAETVLDGGVSTAALQDQAVTTAKIADGSVTLAKLALTNGKFVGLDADTLDGLDSSAFAPASIVDVLGQPPQGSSISGEIASIKASVQAGATASALSSLDAKIGTPASGSVSGDLASISGAVATLNSSTAALGPQVTSLLNDTTALQATVGTPASSSLAGDLAALSAKVDALSTDVTSLSSALATVSARQTFDDSCDDSTHGGWPSKTACLADGRWHTVFLGPLSPAGVSSTAGVCSFILDTLKQLAIAPEDSTTSGPQGAYWEVRFGYDADTLPYHGEWHTQDDVNFDLYDSANNLVEITDNYQVDSCNIPPPGSYGYEAFLAVRK